MKSIVNQLHTELLSGRITQYTRKRSQENSFGVTLYVYSSYLFLYFLDLQLK